MSEDPYRILGLRRNASVAAIKAAFRRQAQANHPDRHQGKSAEEQNAHAQQFQRAKWAHDVLSDAGQRAYYHRNGHTRDQAPRIPPEIELTLVSCFRAVAARVRDLRHTDLIKGMRLAITDRMEERRADAQAARNKIEDLAEMEGRLLQRGDPQNVLAAALAEDMAKLHGAENEADRDATHLRRCLDELQHWSYRVGGAPGYFDESSALEEATRR